MPLRVESGRVKPTPREGRPGSSCAEPSSRRALTLPGVPVRADGDAAGNDTNEVAHVDEVRRRLDSRRTPAARVLAVGPLALRGGCARRLLDLRRGSPDAARAGDLARPRAATPGRRRDRLRRGGNARPGLLAPPPRPCPAGESSRSRPLVASAADRVMGPRSRRAVRHPATTSPCAHAVVRRACASTEDFPLHVTLPGALRPPFRLFPIALTAALLLDATGVGAQAPNPSSTDDGEAAEPAVAPAPPPPDPARPLRGALGPGTPRTRPRPEAPTGRASSATTRSTRPPSPRPRSPTRSRSWPSRSRSSRARNWC